MLFPHDAGALQSQVFRLRQRMPGLEIEHRSGYVLHLNGGALDADAFERAVWDAVAQRVDDPARALDRVEDGLALWRGVPYEDLVDDEDGRIEIRRLEEIHTHAIEERFGLLVGMDRAAEALADLEAFVAREPLRERPRHLLIDALVAGGRRADALRVFDSYRRLLAQDLGVAPSPALRARHEQLLAEDDAQPPSAEQRRQRRGQRGLPFVERRPRSSAATHWWATWNDSSAELGWSPCSVPVGSARRGWQSKLPGVSNRAFLMAWCSATSQRPVGRRW